MLLSVDLARMMLLIFYMLCFYYTQHTPSKSLPSTTWSEDSTILTLLGGRGFVRKTSVGVFSFTFFCESVIDFTSTYQSIVMSSRFSDPKFATGPMQSRLIGIDSTVYA